MNNETISMLEFLDEHDVTLSHLENFINLIDDTLTDIENLNHFQLKGINKALSLVVACRDYVEKLNRSATMFFQYYTYVCDHGLDKITLTRYLDCITACEISEAPEKEGDKDIKAGLIAYLKRLTNERQPEQSTSAAV